MSFNCYCKKKNGKNPKQTPVELPNKTKYPTHQWTTQYHIENRTIKEEISSHKANISQGFVQNPLYSNIPPISIKISYAAWMQFYPNKTKNKKIFVFNEQLVVTNQ